MYKNQNEQKVVLFTLHKFKCSTYILKRQFGDACYKKLSPGTFQLW